jgi:hypothetical protein
LRRSCAPTAGRSPRIRNRLARQRKQDDRAAVRRGAAIAAATSSFEGDKAPSVNEFQLKGLPGGEYTVIAVLKNAKGEQTMARRTALVLSALGEPE